VLDELHCLFEAMPPQMQEYAEPAIESPCAKAAAEMD
jgi:hypothetical protein